MADDRVTIEQVYGAHNPWIVWLRRFAPHMLMMSPSKFRLAVAGAAYARR